MTPLYFHGKSVHGPVTAAPEQSFKELIDRLRICPILGITRKAFFALPKAERAEKKMVAFYVPAVFKESPSPRLTEHATHCNLIFLDLDEMPDGKCPAAPFVRNPSSLHEALDGFNFAAHTTASSTPEKPRMRIIVDARAIPVVSYPAAVQTVASLLGLPVVTKESKVPSQPMFLPTMFSDSTDEEHPLIAHRTDGRPFTEQDIRGTGDAYQPQPKTQHEDSDGLDFLRAPLPEITLQITQEALSAIDPDCPYLEWLEVAASLRHQFSPNQSDEAYQVFDEWSSRGQKYGGSEETKAKWDSLRPSPVGRCPVTIRTLLKLAVQSGWDDKQVKADTYESLIDWMASVGTVTELMEQGLQKILAAPQLSATQESMLVNQLRRHANDRFGEKPSVTDIKRDLAKLKARMKEQAKKEEKVQEPRWARGVCYIAATDQFYRHRTGEKYKRQSFDAMYARWLLPTEAQLVEQGLPVTAANLAKPILSPSDYALNHLKITSVYDFAYAPDQPTEMFFVQEGRRYVNMYSPTYPELDHDYATAAGVFFQQHLGNLIKEPEYRRILTDFMAFMVQCPGQKIRWSILIQGAEGAGKTYLAEVMKAVLGKRHVKTVDGETITSGWNEWTFGYQLVVIEEVRVAGSNKHDIMNRLKPWITNDDIPINEKFRSSRDALNITNYLLFSNAHDAIAITPNNRRYCIFKSPLQRREQVKALGPQYFANLFNFLRDHPGAMRAWLMNWEISPEFQPHSPPPASVYEQQMVNDSADDLTACVRRLLREGDHPLVQYDIVSSSQLKQCFLTEDHLGSVAEQRLSKVLREEGLHSLGRVMIQNERHSLWVRDGVDEKTAIEEAVSRVKGDRKNLHMELLFS